MSWFDASNFANLAKNALKEAQKTLDKALEITDEEHDGPRDESSQKASAAYDSGDGKIIQTEPKSTSNTLWESFGVPFFDKPKASGDTTKAGDSSKSVAITEVISSPEMLSYSNPNEIEQSNSNGKEISLAIIRTRSKKLPTKLSSSKISNESNRISMVSSNDSVQGLGSTSSITLESDTSYSKIRESDSCESSVDVISSSSVELINSEDPSRSLTTASSESVGIISIIDHDDGDNQSLVGRADDTLASQSTVTVLEPGQKFSVRDSLRSPSAMDASVSDILSPCDSCISRTIELPESHSELTGEVISDNKLPLRRTRNELSGTSVNTLDSSSCDEGTMIGSSSDEAPKECISSVGSLKSMLADAINEQPDDWTNRGSSPTTSSMESRQENVKIGSSGHTSADELETATSSDIEVISNPNGDGSSADSRQSPAKLIYKSSKGKMSVVLSSDILIPEVIGRSLIFKGHNREPSEASSGGSDDSIEIDKLLKKIAELNEILDARETKLMDLSIKNAELSESHLNLQSQLECQMNEEFTQRLAALEKKFQQAIREKEMLRKQLEKYKHTDSSEFDEDKDEIIKELREEGEKLSKQQLTANVLIKKLRGSEKEHLKLISSLRDQYDGLMQEVERAKKSLSAKEELERSQIEAINQLTKNNQTLEKKTLSLQTQIDNLTSSLITAQKEVEERNDKIAELDVRLQKATSLANQEILQKAETALSEEQEARKKLEFSLSNLQLALQALETQHSERETVLRKENQKLLNLVEEYKRKTEMLTEEMSISTKPIAKQLEEEISKSNSATHLWEKQEKELMSTINELQDKLKLSLNIEENQKQRLDSVEDELRDLKITINSLQKSVEDKETQVKFQLKVNDLLREQHEAALAQKSEEIKTLTSQLEDALKQRSDEQPLERLRNINEICKDRSKLKLLLQGEGLDGDDPDSDVSMISPHPSPQPSEENSAWLGPLDEDPGLSSSQKGSIYDGILRPLTSTTSTIDHLQTQNKLKEGEVQQLQWELRKHEHERIILTNEITLLTTKVEDLEKRLTVQCDLQTKYDALLQMYGEKMEECQELKLDLEDVKEMYKIQIEELLTRSRTG